MKSTLVLTTLLFSIIGYSQSNSDRLDQVNDFIANRTLDEAKQLLDSLIPYIDPIEDGELYLKSTTKLVEVIMKMGAYTESVKVGEQLLIQYPNAIETNKKYAAEFYMNLGYAYNLTQSNNEKAITYLTQSLALYKDLKAPDRKLEANILRYLSGAYYYNEDYQASISTLRKCIPLLDSENNKTILAVCMRSIGNSYWGLRDYSQASDYYDKSLSVLYSDNPVDSLTIGQVLHSKGYIHMDQEDFKMAYKTFAKASDLLAKRKPAVSSPMVWIYGDVGRSLIYLEKYDSALIWLQKALNANVFEYSQSDYYQNPPLVNINDEFQNFMILKLKGQAFLQKYLKSNDNADLKGMIDCFMLADSQIDIIRKSIPKADDQSTITYYSSGLYSNAISAMVAVNEMGFEKRFFELAHYFMEKQKITRVHLKFLEASAKSSNILPDEMLNQDQELIDQITTLKSKLIEELKEESDSTDILKKQLFEAEEDYEKFIAEIKTNYPSYHSSRFDLQVASVSEIQALLREKHPNRAIVAYYNFGEKLRTSVLTKDTVVVTVSNHGMDFNSLAQEFRENLITPTNNPAIADTLSTLLIDNIYPILSGISQITFISDPVLQLIPMELIWYDDKYLFEQFDIGYHYSATIFAKQNVNKYYSMDFAGFAPSFDSISFSTLPGAKREVNGIANVIGGSTFIGEEAQESTLKSVIFNSGLLHLATHAEINESKPESSFLQFNNSNGEEDGKLHFFEIYDLAINAHLVTLSACNTGYGKIQRGEGVMSLSRAFSYAGVPATVVSLWPASDKSTPELMKHFYQNLKDGQTKDVALNNARKQYLATAVGKARHPFYWGGFVLIGDNSAIEEDLNLLVYLIPSMLVVVMILTVYRRKKNRT